MSKYLMKLNAISLPIYHIRCSNCNKVKTLKSRISITDILPRWSEYKCRDCRFGSLRGMTGRISMTTPSGPSNSWMHSHWMDYTDVRPRNRFYRSEPVTPTNQTDLTEAVDQVRSYAARDVQVTSRLLDILGEWDTRFEDIER